MTQETLDTATEAQQEEQAQPQVSIQRIFIQDCSFESPLTPEIFIRKWEPQMEINLGTSTQALAEKDMHQVVLTVTATVKDGDKTAFLIEVQQAGIFLIQNLEGEALKQALGIFCPNLLYPYARTEITHLSAQGGFPQLYLAPVNFEAMYMQSTQEKPQD